MSNTTKNSPELLASIESTFDTTAHELIAEFSDDTKKDEAFELYWKLAGLIQDNLKKKYPEYNFENF